MTRDRAGAAPLVVLPATALLAVGAGVVESVLGVAHDAPDLALRHCAASSAHWLGCDDIGQDQLARLVFGARVSLAVGLGATLVSTAIGAAVGLVAGSSGRVVDAVVMRVVDAMLAIPLLPLLLLGSAMTIGKDAG